MPREFSRSERVSDAVQQELAELIRSEVRDPRVGMVNITEVEVSRDLAYCKVYVNFVDQRDQAQVDAAVDALNGAAGYLRRRLAASIKLRVTPKLSFYYDESGTRGQHLSALIDYAVSTNKSGTDESSSNEEQ